MQLSHLPIKPPTRKAMIWNTSESTNNAQLLGAHVFSIIAPAIFAPPFSFLLEINVLGCAFAPSSHAPFSSPPFRKRCKTSGVRERGEDGTGTKGARKDSPAQPAQAPNARSCDYGRSAACGRLRARKRSHDAASSFLPPSLSLPLPSLPPSLPLPPCPPVRGSSSGGCWCPLGSGWQPVPPGTDIVEGVDVVV